MIRQLVILALCFVALWSFGGFTGAALAVFGAGCALIALAMAAKAKALALAGLFELALLSPFAVQYSLLAHEVTLLAALLLAVLPMAVLVALSLGVGESGRARRRADLRACALAAAAALLISHSVFALSLIGNLGAFLGDPESGVLQVLVLTFATALLAAALLVPPREARGLGEE